jgi:hypothetical protein
VPLTLLKESSEGEPNLHEGSLAQRIMPPLRTLPKHRSDRCIVMAATPEGADRFGSWANVEYDPKTGTSRTVQRNQSRPTNTRRKADSLILSDPDGEGGF